jgi:NitT/TauT family transport system permease protein
VLVGSGQMLAPLSAIPTAISLSPFVLPLYALRTTMRMLAALTASLIFTFTCKCQSKPMVDRLNPQPARLR